jgi:hypothetical protein
MDCVNKSCLDKKEGLYKDCKNMFEKYQEAFMKNSISIELMKKLKVDIIELEIKVKDYEDNELRDKKIMDKWGFDNLNELTNFINKYRNHSCKCNCKPVNSKNIDLDFDNYMVNYNLSLHDKKPEIIPYYNQIVNKSKYEKYTPNTENIIADNNVYTIPDKVGPPKEFRRSYVLYNFKKLVNKVIENNKKQFKINIINKRKINIINRIKDYLEKNKKLTFEEICNIPLPPVSYDEDILLNINIVNKKKIKDTPKNIKPRNKKQNTNQLKVIRNIIDKIVKTTNTVKNKNNELYNLLYNKNRNNIDIYSYIYTNENSLETVELVDGKIDKNNSRLKLICNVFDKIKNTPKIYNSDYILNYYTFKQINNEGFEELIKELNNLCKDNTPNVTNEESESDKELCNICFTNEIEDEDNGTCFKCLNDLI